MSNGLTAELNHDFDAFMAMATDQGIVGGVIQTNPLQEMAYGAVFDIALNDDLIFDFDASKYSEEEQALQVAKAFPRLLKRDYGQLETAVVYHGSTDSEESKQTSLAFQFVVPTVEMIENGMNATFMIYAPTDKGLVLIAVGGFEDDSTFLSDFPEHGKDMPKVMEALCGKALQSMIFLLARETDLETENA